MNVHLIQLEAIQQGKSLAVKETMFRLVQLALMRNRDITIGTNDPILRYRELRERFPNVLMTIGEFEVRVIADRKATP